MRSRLKFKLLIFIMALPVIVLASVPEAAAFPRGFQLPPPSPSGAQSFNWPQDSINLSDLQNILSQYPGLNQLNIQFPNQANWNISPATIKSIINDYQQEAQAIGVDGKLPPLTFSSLAAAGLKEGAAQLSITSPEDLKNQIDNVVHQLRYQDLNLGGWLPDWLKQFLVAVYDAVYSTFDYLGQKLAELFR